MPKKSGSEKRKRQNTVSFRLDDDELAEFKKRCDDSSFTKADYFRVKCIEEEPLRKKPKPSVEVVEVVKLRSAINQVGSNLNQIAARLNSMAKSERELNDAEQVRLIVISSVRKMQQSVDRTLGYDT